MGRNTLPSEKVTAEKLDQLQARRYEFVLTDKYDRVLDRQFRTWREAEDIAFRILTRQAQRHGYPPEDSPIPLRISACLDFPLLQRSVVIACLRTVILRRTGIFTRFGSMYPDEVELFETQAREMEDEEAERRAIAPVLPPFPAAVAEVPLPPPPPAVEAGAAFRLVRAVMAAAEDEEAERRAIAAAAVAEVPLPPPPAFDAGAAFRMLRAMAQEGGGAAAPVLVAVPVPVPVPAQPASESDTDTVTSTDGISTTSSGDKPRPAVVRRKVPRVSVSQSPGRLQDQLAAIRASRAAAAAALSPARSAAAAAAPYSLDEEFGAVRRERVRNLREAVRGPSSEADKRKRKRK